MQEDPNQNQSLPQVAPVGDQVQQPITSTQSVEVPPPPSHQEVTYAGYWVRSAARSFDGLILMLLLFPGTIYLFYQRLSQAQEVGYLIQYFVILGLLSSIAMTLAEMFFVTKFGASPGKMFFGLKIIDKMGQTPNLKTVAMRLILPVGVSLFSFSLSILKSLSAFQQLSTLIITIDGFSMLKNPQKQTIHDKMAGTYVVFIKPLSPIKKVLVVVVQLIGLLAIIILVAMVYVTFIDFS